MATWFAIGVGPCACRPGHEEVLMPEGDELLVEQARALAFAYYEAFTTRDWDTVRRVCAPDVVLIADAHLRGHDALIGYMSELHRHFPGIYVDVHETASSARHVVCENDYIAPAGVGWSLDGRGCTVHLLRDGLIAEIREYYVPSSNDRAGEGNVMTPQLAQEQAALRRVSSLVAGGAEPDDVFAAVGREIGLLVGADATSLFQFYDDDTMRLVSVWSRDNATFPVGDRRPMNPPMLELRRTAVALRFESLPDGSPFLEEARAYGVETAVALPLLVEDAVWGVVFATSKAPGLLRPDAEDRAMRFTSLAGIALAHSRARDNLTRSRARVLAAADASRRQVQRDLHDGAQQRLVHAIIELNAASEAAASHECAAAWPIAEALRQADRARAELHDLVRGILPVALTRHGLRAALESMVAYLPLEVTIHVDDGRLPASVETTAYFVIAEALTNVVKHANVDSAVVTADVREGELTIEVRDDGRGGATNDIGTGLDGLADRVEANDGTLTVDSPVDGGTTIRARIPIPAG